MPCFHHAGRRHDSRAQEALCLARETTELRERIKQARGKRLCKRHRRSITQRSRGKPHYA